MATAKPKVVSTVKRGPHRPAKATATPAPAPKRPATDAKTAAARASRKAAVAPLLKKKTTKVVVPVVKREEPHVLKSTEGKPLVERLNAKLLEQLRTRKVTNKAAAQALGVDETYLCRILKEMGQEKTKGVTSEHREARAALIKARNGTREQLAKRANKGEISVEQAAKEANCTVRTMYRWCEKYANLKKPAGAKK